MNPSIQIAHVVAISENHAIGKDNQLPWHISADLQHFKRLTAGGVVIMGRKTFESMGSKPLPNRINIVVTSDSDYQAIYPNILVATSLAQAIEQGTTFAQQKNLDTIWVIGGERMFSESLPITNRLEITHVATTIDNANAFYPAIPDDFMLSEQSEPQQDEKSGLGFVFATYRKKD